MTDREAAERAGIDPGRAAYVKAKPRVKEYMEQHRASVRAGLVQHEVEALAEFNISREKLLAKYLEFVNIDPKLTGYNTSGQTKALDSLWKALGFDDSKKPGEEEPEPEPPNIYRPPWLLERQRGIFREKEESHEPAPSSPEPKPAPEPARIDRPPAAVPESPIGHPGVGTRKRVDEPAETHPRIPGANFGRFQGLG